MDNFIYVFSEKDKDTLLSAGYHLMKIDESNGIFVFENNRKLNFDMETIEAMYSNVLTF